MMHNPNISLESAIHASRFVNEGDYWQRKLSGSLGKSAFPLDPGQRNRDKELKTSRVMADYHFACPQKISAGLIRIANKSDARLNMILIAGVVVLLGKYTHHRDIIMGTPVYRQETEGKFVNTVLPLRNLVNPHLPFKNLLLQVRQTINEAIENQNYPMEALLHRLGIAFKGEDDFPLFDVGVLLRNIHDEKYFRHFNLNMLFSFFRKDELLQAVIKYNSILYGPAFIERLAAHWLRLMDQVARGVEVKIAELDILSEEEKKQQLLDFNCTHTPYPRHMTLQGLFQQQVERTPHHIALMGQIPGPADREPYQAHIFSEIHLSYRELNKKSNQLAHLLRQKGVQQDTIVGVLLDRSPHMVISLVAILKAGGAYFPIDPEMPQYRMTRMLEDCRAPMVLTTESIIKKLSFTRLQGLQTIGRKPCLTAPRAPIADFDAVPIPDRSLVDYEKYNQYIGLMMVKNSMSLQASRGCPFHCAYCHKLWPKKHLMRSPEHIFAEVKRLYDLGVRRFSFVDDVFNLNVKNSRRFFQLIIEQGLEVQLFFGLRGDVLSEDYIDLMVQAGTVRMAMALETASPRLQKLIGKNLNIEKLRKNLEYICQKHPHVLLELHSIVGIVTETEEEARLTLDFIKSIRWVDFNNFNILKIYPNTDMERLALENGIPAETIAGSSDLGYHEVPETLPFEKNFVLTLQSEFFNDYFLSKQRLLQRLPYQMKVLSEDEMVQKYNSYLPVEIASLEDLLNFVGISRQELPCKECPPEETYWVPGLNRKLQESFPAGETHEHALRLLLLDLSQFFSHESDILYDVVEPPVGLMYVMTYLKQQFGAKINGKIAKSRIDFDSYDELKELVDRFKPQVIGIRTLTFFKDFFHRTVSILRQWGIEAVIISGGPYATSDYLSILQDGNVDVIVLGEGEITAAELIGKIMENSGKLPTREELKQLPGIVFMSRDDSPPVFSRELVMVDRLDAAGQCGDNLEIVNHPSDLAYTIFTSGSTGTPKGVMIRHSSVVNVVSWFARQYRVQEHVNVLQMSDYTFDASVNQLFAALLHGGVLHVIGKDLLLDTRALACYIDTHRIHILNFVPVIFRELLGGNRKLPSVRAVISGGEKLDDPLKNFILEKGYQLYNQYGPTEVTIDALREKCSGAPVTLGTPIANTTCYIVDNQGNPGPPGIPGELVVGGDGLARGYLNNPELTKERFIANPFEKGKRLYRTGDLVRFTPGGSIEYLGRIDSQVKIRGHRIELNEIENQLLEYPGINAVAAAVKDGLLCAYIVSVRDIGEFRTELSEYLQQRLPHYMVPAHFIRVDRIPLTSAGKVDRKALLEIEIDTEKPEAPGDEVEEKMAGLWVGVLDLDRETLSINANFFELGGHSLTAVTLLNRIHEVFHTRVPLAEIFRTPTIKGISQIIRESVKEEFCPIEPVEKKEYYPLSPAQGRLYVLQQMEEETTAYNTPKAAILEGKLHKETLQNCFHQLIQRHESLRTSFHMINDQPVQKIHANVDFEIECYNSGKQGERERGNFLKNSGRQGNREIGNKKFPLSLSPSLPEFFIHPFDLSQAPLLRVGLKEIDQHRHLLMIDMHHIVTDGTSMDILVKEFMAIYSGVELPLLRLQYKDYSLWQGSEGQREALKSQEAYWLAQFAGEIPVLNLPLDFPRPVVQDFSGRRLHFELPVQHTQELIQLALSRGTTLYMVLLGIFTLLLSKLSGQEDIVMGTPIAARRHTDLEKIMGMFVNTLVMRNYLEGSKTFAGFLAELKTNTLQAFENQEYQFEDLVEGLAVQRDTSRNPLFDAMFAQQNIEVPEMEIPGLKLKPYAFETLTSPFDLALQGYEAEEKLMFSVDYRTRLFQEATIRRWIDYFQRIIGAVTHDPDSKISRLEIISAEEKEQVLYNFNDTAREYPSHKTIHELFAEQVIQTPDQIVLVGVHETHEKHKKSDNTSYRSHMSYKELNQKSHQLAQQLIERGVTVDTIVGIMLERSIEMIIGILGILKAGGAYMPIDPDYPQERINYMLKDSSAKMLVTTSNIIKEAGKLGSWEAEKCASRPSDLAYILYTSGSTGTPKGVMVDQRNVIRLVKNTDYICFSPGDRLLLTGNLVFDITTFEIWGPLLNGSILVLVNQEDILKGDLLKNILAKNRVNILHLVPAVFNQLASASGGLENFAGLRYFLVGGDLVKPEYINKLKDRFKNLKILHMYGPTENTTFSTYYPVDQYFETRIPIGKPIGNSWALVIGSDMILQPIGIAGELAVGGDGIARGYLNNPELTAQKFLSISLEFYRSYKSYMSYISKKLYKTGDLARWLPEGNIEFLGRMDHQVKIRGMRIEPGEIEQQILKKQSIKEAVVTVIKEENKDQYLCAYFVSTGEIDSTGLKLYLQEVLPGYMVPLHFIRLDRIPLTSNGKLDRKALPLPVIESGEHYSPPGNNIEIQLVDIWSQLLGIEKEKIGIDANFFELGGHSLKVTVLAARLHSALDIKVPAAKIFETPSIRKLSQYIARAQPEKFVAIQAVEKREYYPISSAQRRLYIYQQLDVRDTSYNMYQVLVIKSPLERTKLTRVFKHLIRRHEILRTSLTLINNEPVQRVHEEVPFQIKYHPLYEINRDQQDQDDTAPALKIIKNFLRPFQLEEVPLIRVGLIKTKAEEYILMLDAHHRAVDGISMKILLKEFIALYKGETLPALRLQYKDFTAWQNRLSRSGRISKQEAYWLNRFQGDIPYINITTDYPRPARRRTEASQIHLGLEKELSANLDKLALQTETTLFMVLMASINVLIAKYVLTNPEDIIIGLPIAGRSHAGLENVLGMFVNMLALRNSPRPHTSFREFLKEVRKNLLDAYENQDYQFEELVTKLKIERDLSKNPIFDIVFVMDDVDTVIPGIEDFEIMIEPYPYNYSAARFDLIFHAHPSVRGLNCSISYSTALFKRETLELMIENYKDILSQVVENPGIKLEDIRISKHLLKADDFSQEDEVAFNF